MIIKRIINRLQRIYYQKEFGEYGKNVIIKEPLQLDGMNRIHIGNNVVIQYKTWLAANPLTGIDSCALIIKDGAVIGNFNHIYATNNITIEKNALLADKVYISDNLHGYEDIVTPIRFQKIIQKKTVCIGEGSWIGENVAIIGANVGKHSVVGANSVVTKDIPDYSVAVGNPARVIKKYDFQSNTWVRVEL